MKILHVTPAFSPANGYGGPIPALDNLCLRLAEEKCKIRVLTTNTNGLGQTLDVTTREDIEVADRIRIRYCRRIARHSLSLQLLRLLPEYLCWADVVHLTAVYNFPIIPTLLLCKIMNKPVVWSPHGVLQRWKGSRRRRLKALWEWVCRAVAPNRLILHTSSQLEADESRRVFPRFPVVVIPWGVTIPQQVQKVPRNGMLRLLYLGRLDAKKGIENLIDACKLLATQDGPEWSLTIAGAGNPRYTSTLVQRIHEAGLASDEIASVRKVRLVGEVIGAAKDIHFENADVLILPSYTENFSVVVAEALAREVPVIASTGTPWNRLEQQGCGLSVKNDPQSLATAITRISHLPLRDMGQRGRRWMKQEFSGADTAQRMVGCYADLLNRQIGAQPQEKQNSLVLP